METNKICKYCELELQVCLSEGLNCTVCSRSIHLECLDKGAVPGELNGDVFYIFTCKECSLTKKEVFVRDNLSYLQAVALTLYNLRTKNIYLSKRGYFHMKDHIACFIEDHWDILFKDGTKRKQKMVQAISSILYHFNYIFFQSGEEVLGERNLWTLKYPKLTPSAIWNLYLIFRKLKEKIKQEGIPASDVELFESVLQENIQDKSLLVAVDDESPHLADKDSPITAHESSTSSKHKRESTETGSPSLKLSKSRTVEHSSFSGPSTSNKPLSDPASAPKPTAISGSKRRKLGRRFLPRSKSFSPRYKPLSYSASVSNSSKTPSASAPKPTAISGSKRRKLGRRFSSRSKSFSYSASVSNSSKISRNKRRCTKKKSCPSELPSRTKEDDILGCPCRDYEDGDSPESDYLSTPNSSDSSSTNSSTPSPPVTEFLDSSSSSKPLLSVTEFLDSSSSSSNSSTPSLSSEAIEEFLDPSYYFNTCMTSLSTVKHIELKTKLMGGYRKRLIKSPYSGVFLKPYIWRDTETFPPWLQLMCQIQSKGNQHIRDYVIPPRASIDYAYFQPEHIPAVNSLCNRFFWLGIDLTESLRYPEFGCVVLYKRLIVAFAFIIPNVNHTEHYLSYIFTRPGWRQVGIAKRMLFFLIKNCAGKDVTLHVSLNNVAYSMYHKFGFKVERIERNFYKGYIRMKDESKDALFCRRERSHSGEI